MENNLIKFSKYVKENPVNKEYNERITTLNGKISFIGKEQHTFMLCAKSFSPGFMCTGYPTEHLITLDEEDLIYFTNKYLPKLEQEMEAKINKIREEYGKE